MKNCKSLKGQSTVRKSSPARLDGRYHYSGGRLVLRPDHASLKQVDVPFTKAMYAKIEERVSELNVTPEQWLLALCRQSVRAS